MKILKIFTSPKIRTNSVCPEELYRLLRHDHCYAPKLSGKRILKINKPHVSVFKIHEKLNQCNIFSWFHEKKSLIPACLNYCQFFSSSYVTRWFPISILMSFKDFFHVVIFWIRITCLWHQKTKPRIHQFKVLQNVFQSL